MLAETCKGVSIYLYVYIKLVILDGIIVHLNTTLHLIRRSMTSTIIRRLKDQERLQEPYVATPMP
jgi:hypothetical protein